jgi:hypothetical protein
MPPKKRGESTMTKLQMVLGGSAVVAVFALAGCGKNKAVVATEEYSEKVCACKDADCVKKESEAFAKKAEEMKDAKGSDADAKAIEEAMKKALDCSMKVAMKDMPGAGKEDKKDEKK